MKTIKIKKNTLGDTRTADRVPTITEFQISIADHRADVYNMMHEIARDIDLQGRVHDFTKTSEPEASLFYRELCATIEGKMDFEKGEWYPMHCQAERHHLTEHCPEDVNLIDVIEMICDCVCAGMARSGSVRHVQISNEILQQAVANTVQRCFEAIEPFPSVNPSSCNLLCEQKQ